MIAATREALAGLPAEVGPLLLGAVLETVIDGERVAVRITEVEAYHGRGTGDRPDPGSHARMGRTARNATMWGESGHLYVYLSHGIHSCVNVVCGPEGLAGGLLLRAGEVIEGADAATRRRLQRRPAARRAAASVEAPSSEAGPPVVPASIPPRDLARGPGRLGDAVGLRHPIHDGIDAITGAEQAGAVARLWLPGEPVTAFATGPRVGVAGVAGTAEFPWRFWLPNDPTVSPFRWGRGAQALSPAANRQISRTSTSFSRDL